MNFSSRARRVHFSPFKLRPLADVVRGKGADFALQWLSSYPIKRAQPLKKAIESAVANARQSGISEPSELVVQEIKVDEGPIVKYFKPGAMGRSNVYRKRFSHISVILKPVKKEV
jgi:large subunit ribosomal protein L22